MPRLPGALGLGGAKRTGGLDRTLDPPMRSDSPNSSNPLSPSPLEPLHSWQLPTSIGNGARTRRFSQPCFLKSFVSAHVALHCEAGKETKKLEKVSSSAVAPKKCIFQLPQKKYP
eukprot:scaffold35194_cov118-Isochrysis_galbana.AAC.4